jgi:hypothetical protein
MELFNRDFGDMSAGRVPADTRALWVDEPVIVPLRAALEGTVYTGPDALENFRAASAESWEWLRIDVDQLEEVGDSACVVSGTLTGRGRATGAETSMAAAFAIEVVSDRVAAARVFPSREAALEEVAG